MNALKTQCTSSQSLPQWLTTDIFVLFQGFAPLARNKVLTNPIVNLVAEKLGKTTAQVTLRWGLQMGHSLVPKSTNPERIRENFDIFDWSIPEDLFAKFSEINQASAFPPSFHSLFLVLFVLVFALDCHYKTTFCQSSLFDVSFE